MNDMLDTKSKTLTLTYLGSIPIFSKREKEVSVLIINETVMVALVSFDELMGYKKAWSIKIAHKLCMQNECVRVNRTSIPENQRKLPPPDFFGKGRGYSFAPVKLIREICLNSKKSLEEFSEIDKILNKEILAQAWTGKYNRLLEPCVMIKKGVHREQYKPAESGTSPFSIKKNDGSIEDVYVLSMDELSTLKKAKKRGECSFNDDIPEIREAKREGSGIGNVTYIGTIPLGRLSDDKWNSNMIDSLAVFVIDHQIYIRQKDIESITGGQNGWTAYQFKKFNVSKESRSLSPSNFKGIISYKNKETYFYKGYKTRYVSIVAILEIVQGNEDLSGHIELIEKKILRNIVIPAIKSNKYNILSDLKVTLQNPNLDFNVPGFSIDKKNKKEKIAHIPHKKVDGITPIITPLNQEIKESFIEKPLSDPNPPTLEHMNDNELCHKKDIMDSITRYIKAETLTLRKKIESLEAELLAEKQDNKNSKNALLLIQETIKKLTKK